MDKQLNFKAGDLLPAFSRVFGGFERIQLKKLNLTAPQSYTLLVIQESELINMNDLSNKARVSQTTMSRMIDNLVRDGFVERLRNESDRRIVEVRLTGKGADKVYELKEFLDLAGKNVIQKISPDKQLQVAESIVILLDVMEKVFIRPE